MTDLDALQALADQFTAMGSSERAVLGAPYALIFAAGVSDLVAEVRRLSAALVEAERWAKRFQVLFDGGPETSCRTVWDDDGVECVSVPLADVRWAFGDSDV